MAQKLSVQIALEGGAELKRQFAELGAEGTKAFTDIKKAAAGVGGFQNLDPTKVTKALQDVGVTGVGSINKIQAAVTQAGRLEGLVQGVKQLEDGFSALGKVITPLGGQFKQLQQAASATYRVLGPIGVAGGAAFLAVGAAIVTATKLTIGFAQSINKTSAEAIKLGLSFKTFDQLKLRMEQAGMPAQAISAGITALQGNLDKLEISKLKKLAEEMAKVQQLGVRFAPGQGPLKQFEDAITRIGPAGDFAREAIRKINEETQKSGNIRFAPGVVSTLAQIRANADPVIAGFNELGIVGTKVGEQADLVSQKLSEMTDTANRNRLALLLMGEAGGTAFIQTLKSSDAQEDAANRLVGAIERLTAAWNRFGSVSIAPELTAGINLLTKSIEGLQTLLTSLNWSAFEAGARLALNPFSTLVQLITTGIANAFGSGTAKAQQLGAAAQQSAQAIEAIKPVPDPFVAANAGAVQLQRNLAGVAQALQKMGAEAALWNRGAFGQGIEERMWDQPGMAGGGLLGGRGTGTSDSNLAWLSRGEYVTPAHAVAQPGVLAFLEALRRSGGNLSRVLNGMGRFALGGMVPRSIPAFAAGGLNSGSNVTIQFPGLPPISGLRASSGVVDQLHKAAALAQVRSGGRKPSRYS